LVTTVLIAIYGLRNDLILRLSNGQSFVRLLISGLSFRSWSEHGLGNKSVYCAVVQEGLCRREEGRLFKKAESLLARLPFDEIDPPVVDRIGETETVSVQFGFCAFYPLIRVGFEGEAALRG
jgi:hypothetical protein